MNAGVSAHLPPSTLLSGGRSYAAAAAAASSRSHSSGVLRRSERAWRPASNSSFRRPFTLRWRAIWVCPLKASDTIATAKSVVVVRRLTWACPWVTQVGFTPESASRGTSGQEWITTGRLRRCSGTPEGGVTGSTDDHDGRWSEMQRVRARGRQECQGGRGSAPGCGRPQEEVRKRGENQNHPSEDANNATLSGGHRRLVESQGVKACHEHVTKTCRNNAMSVTSSAGPRNAKTA